MSFLCKRVENTVEKGEKKPRCVCETLMPSKHPSYEKHDLDI